MHDTVWFETQGKPSVSIASTEFDDAGKIQATALGMPDAKRVLVPHPIQDADDPQMYEKADAIVVEIIAALSS